MALDLLNALLSSGLGFISGAAGGAVMERFKSQVAGIEVELGRIDDFHELLADTAAMDAVDSARPAQVRQLITMRRRLGRAINRQVVTSDGYNRAAAKLNIVTRLLARAEEGSSIPEPEMDLAFSELRRALERETKHRRTFRAMRG